MLVYDVHYAYVKNGRIAARDYSKVIAENPAEAERAFRAIHPNGSIFRYDIVETRRSSL